MISDLRAAKPSMGKAPVEELPLSKRVLVKCDEVLESLPDRPSWSIVHEMRKADDASNVYKSLYSQPLCTALQLGVIILLRSWGVSLTAVLGHSSGEIAAAYAAGLLSIEHAIIVAHYRGMFLERSTLDASQKRDGSIGAVGMSRSDAVSPLE